MGTYGTCSGDGGKGVDGSQVAKAYPFTGSTQFWHRAIEQGPAGGYTYGWTKTKPLKEQVRLPLYYYNVLFYLFLFSLLGEQTFKKKSGLCKLLF